MRIKLRKAEDLYHVRTAVGEKTGSKRLCTVCIYTQVRAGGSRTVEGMCMGSIDEKPLDVDG